MNMKYGTVVNENGKKVAFVRVAIDAETGMETPLLSPMRPLLEGETIIYDDWQIANGMVKGQWTGEIWEETATVEEIAEYRAAQQALFIAP